MIRVRAKSTHITIRINGGEKQRYTSAIHALHVIRMAVVNDGLQIEPTEKTQAALRQCLTRSKDELAAAIDDVTSKPETAVCVVRQMDGLVEKSYYQTTDKRHLYVVRHWGTAIYEDHLERGSRIWYQPVDVPPDDAIRQLGYIIAPG